MFYNVIGLAFVSCFICAVVNAIDDFNAMRNAVQWAKRSFSSSSKSERKGSSVNNGNSKSAADHNNIELNERGCGGENVFKTVSSFDGRENKVFNSDG